LGAAAPRRAVFLDRDGTLNRDLPRAVARPEDLVLLPGAADALRALERAGFARVVVTNQSAIARGDLDPERLGHVHAALSGLLARAGAGIELWGWCPHHPSEGLPPYRRACRCRKPEPGLLQAAARRLGRDLAASWIVGDAERDLLAGASVGARGVLVGTGKGGAERERLERAGRPPRYFAPDLAAAAELIVRAV
jgi:D-glycero-D-manno-heptose 1,7-bisphosphate phosphatase